MITTSFPFNYLKNCTSFWTHFPYADKVIAELPFGTSLSCIEELVGKELYWRNDSNGAYLTATISKAELPSVYPGILEENEIALTIVDWETNGIDPLTTTYTNVDFPLTITEMYNPDTPNEIRIGIPNVGMAINNKYIACYIDYTITTENVQHINYPGDSTTSIFVFVRFGTIDPSSYDYAYNVLNLSNPNFKAFLHDYQGFGIGGVISISAFVSNGWYPLKDPDDPTSIPSITLTINSIEFKNDVFLEKVDQNVHYPSGRFLTVLGHLL